MNGRRSEQVGLLETPVARPELSGFPARDEEAVVVPESEGWITPELIQDTQRVWSKRYGRPITQEDALEILINVKNVAVAFLRTMKGEDE
jgi:hypothetical protein